MNAAHAHVCASLLYKAKLRSKRTVRLSIHSFSVTAQLGHKPTKCPFSVGEGERWPGVGARSPPASEMLLARQPSADKEGGNHS